MVTGPEAKVGDLIENENRGWEIRFRGSVRKTHNIFAFAWDHGPAVNDQIEVKATGSEHIIVEDGKVRRFRAIINELCKAGKKE